MDLLGRHNMPPNTSTSTSASLSFSWFTGAPVTRLWTAASIVAYAASKPNFRRWCGMDSSAIRLQFELHRYWASKIFFTTPGELVMGSLLLFYLCRKYERELGSRKFSILVLLSNALTIVMEMIYLQTDIFYRKDQTVYRYTGPYPLMGALFWLFHRFAPRLYPKLFGALGFHFSEKTLYYLFFGQCINASGISSVIATLLGAVACQISLNFLSWIDWPQFVVNFASDINHRFGDTAPVVFLPQRTRQARPPPTGRHAEARTGPAPARPDADPEAIDQLCNMGFDRAQVVQALQLSNNDVQRAAELLLAQ